MKNVKKNLGQSKKDWGESGRKKGGKWESEPKYERMRWGGEGSGEYRISGVFYLWSKCTLAFLLSSPQMQLDSSLAKQTQMKWLLNDFLGNLSRQRKPSIWSLLVSSLPLLFLLTHLRHVSHFAFLSFSCVFFFDLLAFPFHLYCHIFFLFRLFSCTPCLICFTSFPCLNSCLFCFVSLFSCLFFLFHQVTWKRIHSQIDKPFNKD